jgi:hypothetical protein
MTSNACTIVIEWIYSRYACKNFELAACPIVGAHWHVKHDVGENAPKVSKLLVKL